VTRATAFLLGISGGLLALDQWTKSLATEHLAHQPPVELLGEFLRLTYTKNSGVAFGLGAGTGFPYWIFSVAAVLVILALFARERVHGRAQKIALSLIMGGALGNLVDRLATGEVVDFIEIGWDRWHWPVFNVADTAVSIGVVLFALAWSRHDPARETAEAQDGTDMGTGSPSRAHGGEAGPVSGTHPDRPVA
jgi:signal peptidase II